MSIFLICYLLFMQISLTYFICFYLEDIKADITKSNALKRAASDKQTFLEKLYQKKKKLAEKKNEMA